MEELKGFIEVTYLDKWFTEHKIKIHYSQVWFYKSKIAYFQDKLLKESYEEIKELIKKAQ